MEVVGKAVLLFGLESAVTTIGSLRREAILPSECSEQRANPDLIQHYGRDRRKKSKKNHHICSLPHELGCSWGLFGEGTDCHRPYASRRNASAQCPLRSISISTME